MTELWLVRHGQTDWNLTGRWQGQAPQAPGLNEAGWKQVLAARDQLKDIRFCAVYASDLLRSRQTAERIAESLDLSVHFDPRLREINLGAWEGMLSDDIKAQYPAEMDARAKDPFHTRAPGGESPHQVSARVHAAVAEIGAKHLDGSVLIIAHGLSLAVILCHAHGIPTEQVYDHIPENAKPQRVEWK